MWWWQKYGNPYLMQCIWWPMVAVWFYTTVVFMGTARALSLIFSHSLPDYSCKIQGQKFPVTSFICSNLFSVEQTPPVCSAFWFCPHVMFPWNLCPRKYLSPQLNQILFQLWSGPHCKVDTFIIILHKITCIIFHPFPDAFLVSGLLYQM